MPDIPVLNCCGCTACYNACPRSAIRMTADAEGFSYPVVDKDLCIECGLCEKVCPVHTYPKLSESFADCVIAQSESDEVLEQSTSGGFIDALCKFILCEKNGYAAGVVYNEDFLPIHIVTDSYEEAKQFRNSKYVEFAFYGLRAASLGLITSALLSVAKIAFIGTNEISDMASIIGAINYKAVILSIIIFVCIKKFNKIHPIVLILISGLAGILLKMG